MPSLLGNRSFATTGKGSGGTAITRAKKLADLYIRNNTNEAGVVTDPAVYEYVTNNILAPYADDLSIQQKIASYSNNVKKLKATAFDQDNTLATFKQNVTDALYTRGSVGRDPAKMALFSATALYNVQSSLDNAIAYAAATGKSTDKLDAYRKEVTQMASDQRDLVNQLNSGTNPQNLDGYGYFVKTNPVDGSLVGVALLPVNSAPSDIKQGMKRVDNNIGINGSNLPVYLPVTKDSNGVLTAKLYNNTWTGGESDPTLSGDNTPDFQNKNTFDIRDVTKFPIKKNDISPGNFAKVPAGYGSDGLPAYTYLYRGADSKVRKLDQAGLDAFKNDPIFGSKVSDLDRIQLLAPDEVKGLGQIDNFDPSEVSKWSGKMKLDSALADQAAAQKNLDDFENNPAVRAFSGFQNATDKIGDALSSAVGSVVNGVGSFFSNRKNKQNKPDQAPQGDKTSYNAPDVVNNGKKFFSGSPDNIA